MTYLGFIYTCQGLGEGVGMDTLGLNCTNVHSVHGERDRHTRNILYTCTGCTREGGQTHQQLTVHTHMLYLCTYKLYTLYTCTGCTHCTQCKVCTHCTRYMLGTYTYTQFTHCTSFIIERQLFQEHIRCWTLYMVIQNKKNCQIQLKNNILAQPC